MTHTFHATFDGQVLRPEEPLSLAPNSRVLITISTDEAEKGPGQSFLRTARALNLEGPADWSANLDNYLYGANKDSDG